VVNSTQVPLKIRQGFVLVFVLIIALPVLFYSISSAYYASLVDATENNLEAHLYSLISEVEFIDESVKMPNTILAPELNRIDSDTFALIYQNNDLVWYSESAVSLDFNPNSIDSQIGASEFKQVFYQGNSYWQLSLTVILGNAEQSQQAVFILLRDDKALTDVLSEFTDTLMSWMLILGAIMTLLMSLGFIWNMRPLQRLDKEIKAIESGKKERLSHSYPIELQAITEDLNLLLESQRRQKERYRASLSDLAHALKTPLAVLKSSPLANDSDAQEQLDKINSMIEHQLKRAATGGTDTWKKKTTIAPILDSILNAMKKVYHQKVIEFQAECPKDLKFLGDKTDLMEILGNLIDNACKACDSLVQVNVSSINKTLKIEITDDGPGIEPSARKKLLQRGTRLDTYEAGHGVGLAIVADLVSDYQGIIKIDSAPIGGAQFIIEFKYD
jgi:two-component system sensor histidine kinase PhoQ